jgi:arylformamidase
LFVASLGLLMTGTVELSNVQVFAGPHKGTRGGPSDRSRGTPAAGGRLVELNHVIRAIRAGIPGGARFTAVPLRIEGFGTIPVRAFARLPG